MRIGIGIGINIARYAAVLPPAPSDIDQTALAGRWRPSRAASCWSDNGVTPATLGGFLYRVDDEVGSNHILQATALERPTWTANVSPSGHSGAVFASGKSLATVGNISTTDTTYYWVGMFVAGSTSTAFARLASGIATEWVYYDSATNGAAADTATVTRGTSRAVVPAADALPTSKLGVVALTVASGGSSKLYVDGVLVATNASSPGTTALNLRLTLNLWAVGFSTYQGQNACLELAMYAAAHDATAVAANSAILLSKYATLGSWTPLDLPSGVMLRLHAPLSLADLGATNSGAGSAADGGDVGWVKDEKATADSRSLDPLVQASAGVRPTLGYHAKGKGVAIKGSGGAAAGGDFLVSGSSITGIKWALAVAHAIGPDVGRPAGAPVNLWNDNFHGLVGTSPVAFSASLFTGNNGTNAWLPSSCVHRRDSVLTEDGGVGRTDYIYQASHSSTADAGVLNVGRFVGSDSFYWRGSLRALALFSSSAQPWHVANTHAWLKSKLLTGPIIAITGDSNGASFGDGSGLSSVVKETESLAALLHENWKRCISVCCLAVPGQGVTASVSPLTQTLTVDDPAKLAAIKRTHSPAILLVVAGTNDLWNGRTAVQLRADLVAYVAARKAEGWKVVVTTVAARAGSSGWTAGMETQRGIYNAALRADYSFADALLDIDTINPGLQGDNVHFSVAGVASVAAGAITVIDGLLP